jgi:hypothetical protein
MEKIIYDIEWVIGKYRRGVLSDHECVSKIFSICAEALGIRS